MKIDNIYVGIDKKQKKELIQGIIKVIFKRANQGTVYGIRKEQRNSVFKQKKQCFLLENVICLYGINFDGNVLLP
jgi:hypothetical protein